jgi:hypothetical protein
MEGLSRSHWLTGSSIWFECVTVKTLMVMGATVFFRRSG